MPRKPLDLGVSGAAGIRCTDSRSPEGLGGRSSPRRSVKLRRIERGTGEKQENP